MNPLWLFAILPGYAFMGGLTRSIVHNSFHSSQKAKQRCAEWTDFPCQIWAGWMWPFMIPLLIFNACAMLGVQAERLRPVSRRAIRDKKIRELEKENGIGPASQDS